MIGTNDISGKKVPEGYREGLERVVGKCLAAHRIPILNTIPPRRDHDEAVAAVNVIVREIAAAQKLPLVDFHAACLRMRPGKTRDGTII
ncbi:SGNH/GDSL hydrolase family protein, partial [bacterium]|nr:SGNH/GDSL hydrolase family protein [bacterium]